MKDQGAGRLCGPVLNIFDDDPQGSLVAVFTVLAATWRARL
jgi:hypothetical protein